MILLSHVPSPNPVDTGFAPLWAVAMSAPNCAASSSPVCGTILQNKARKDRKVNNERLVMSSVAVNLVLSALYIATSGSMILYNAMILKGVFPYPALLTTGRKKLALIQVSPSLMT